MSVTIKPFRQCNALEIAEAVQMHYNDELDLHDYWKVGDTINAYLSDCRITNTVQGMYISAQNVGLRLIGFDHDDLVTSVNGHTKAAITLETLEPLADSMYYPFPSGVIPFETGNWKGSYLRTMLQNYSTYLTGFTPKLVKKSSDYGRRRQWKDYDNVISNDYVFILSGMEYDGDTYVAHPTGEQYEFYRLAGVSNRDDPTFSKMFTYYTDEDIYPKGGYAGNYVNVVPSINDPVFLLRDTQCLFDDDDNSWTLFNPDFRVEATTEYEIEQRYPTITGESNREHPEGATYAIRIAFCL